MHHLKNKRVHGGFWSDNHQSPPPSLHPHPHPNSTPPISLFPLTTLQRKGHRSRHFQRSSTRRHWPQLHPCFHLLPPPIGVRLDNGGEGVYNEFGKGKVDCGQQGNPMVEVNLVRDGDNLHCSCSKFVFLFFICVALAVRSCIGLILWFGNFFVMTILVKQFLGFHMRIQAKVSLVSDSAQWLLALEFVLSPQAWFWYTLNRCNIMLWCGQILNGSKYSVCSVTLFGCTEYCVFYFGLWFVFEPLYFNYPIKKKNQFLGCFKGGVDGALW